MWHLTWGHVLPQMNSNPSSVWVSIWLAKRCSTCQWSAMVVVCRLILWQQEVRWHDPNRIESLRSVPSPVSVRSHKFSNFKLFTRLWSAQQAAQKLRVVGRKSAERPWDCACNKILDVLACTTQIPHPCTQHRQRGKEFQKMVLDSFVLEGTGPRGHFLLETTVWYSEPADFPSFTKYMTIQQRTLRRHPRRHLI